MSCAIKHGERDEASGDGHHARVVAARRVVFRGVRGGVAHPGPRLSLICRVPFGPFPVGQGPARRVPSRLRLIHGGCAHCRAPGRRCPPPPQTSVCYRSASLCGRFWPREAAFGPCATERHGAQRVAARLSPTGPAEPNAVVFLSLHSPCSAQRPIVTGQSRSCERHWATEARVS
jgi:hypothetical protein